MANLLRRRLPRADWAVTVIDRDNEHYYQPGFLFIPFGFYTRENIVKPRARFLPRGVEFIVAEVDRIDPVANTVVFQDGSDLPYDYLIVATGVVHRALRDARACSTAGATRSSTSTRPTAPRPWPRSSRPSRAGGSSSTSTRRRSSARSRRSSSPSSATTACAATAGATRSSSST
ncbi:MAG: hypothetical protein MZU91_11675 [Desulfosudis oleivorans]|nr:hypothetical protein [Desulfosudis oleivorans]